MLGQNHSGDQPFDTAPQARHSGDLAAQLKEVVRIVPADPVAQLRKVTLWLSPPYPNAPQVAQYHSAEAWLNQNGRNPAMVKSIEFSNVFIFEKESKRMPVFVLHELSHAYHDQVLGEHAGLTAAYARAIASRSYDCVERSGPVAGCASLAF